MSDWKLAKEYTEHIDEIKDLQAEVERMKDYMINHCIYGAYEEWKEENDG